MDNKFIGGFFELEIADENNIYHKNAYALNNGRSSFFYILKNLRPSLVHVPFYCCDSLLAPLKILNIPYEFYNIDKQLDPIFSHDLLKDELMVYINYFGLRKNTVEALVEKYKQQLIIDNTQAFFEKHISETWAFNSARKYFGVPDGSYLYAPYKLQPGLERNKKIITEHLVQRMIGNQQEAFQYFLESESTQSCSPSFISIFSEKILSNIDYTRVAEKRRKNFLIYEKAFAAENKLKLELTHKQVPFCYPLFLNKKINKKSLADKNLFIPAFWKEVMERGNDKFDFEINLASHLLPLPVDHRYNEEDIAIVIKHITACI